MPLPLLQPVTLEGDVVRLEPLTAGHADALAAVGLHPDSGVCNPNRSPRPRTCAATSTAP